MFGLCLIEKKKHYLVMKGLIENEVLPAVQLVFLIEKHHFMFFTWKPR